MYAGLAGICLVFFFTLFGSGIHLTNSFWIVGATICFSISLPLFTAFTLAYIMIIESKLSPDAYEPVLKSKRIKFISYLAVTSFYIGFIFMISYISVFISILISVVSLYCEFELKRLLK